jgi:hypothetical protein
MKTQLKNKIMNELEKKAELFVCKIDLAIECPKMTRKIKKYCHDMQVRAFIAGYKQCDIDFFNDLSTRMEINK